MVYKRGGIYWYKFRWTVNGRDGVRDHFVIRKSARTGTSSERVRSKRSTGEPCAWEKSIRRTGGLRQRLWRRKCPRCVSSQSSS